MVLRRGGPDISAWISEEDGREYAVAQCERWDGIVVQWLRRANGTRMVYRIAVAVKAKGFPCSMVSRQSSCGVPSLVQTSFVVEIH